MFFYRLSIGLETLVIDIKLPELIRTTGCSNDTKRVIFALDNLIIEGLNAESDLENMRHLLIDVAQWINDLPKSDDPSAISPNGYVFAANDKDLCKTTFNEIE